MTPETEPPAPTTLPFGAAFDRLQQIAARLGTDEAIEPERLIALLREGKGLERALREHLDRVEQEVRAIEDGDGAASFRIATGEQAGAAVRPSAPSAPVEAAAAPPAVPAPARVVADPSAPVPLDPSPPRPTAAPPAPPACSPTTTSRSERPRQPPGLGPGHARGRRRRGGPRTSPARDRRGRPCPPRIALRVGVSFVVPLAIGAAIGHVSWGAIATQGAFAAMYANDEPYRRRWPILVGIGLGLALTMALGTLLAPHPWVAAAVGGLVAGAAALACIGFEVGPPREFMLVLSYYVGASLPVDPGAAPARAGLVLAGAAIVIAVSMAGQRLRPRAPEETAVAGAYRQVAGLAAALGGEDVAAARHEAVLAVRRARAAMRAAGAGDPLRGRLTEMTVAVEAVLDGCLGLVARESRPIDPAWPAALRALAGSVREPALAGPVVLPEEQPPTPPGARFAAAMGSARQAADPERLFSGTIVPFTRARRPRALAILRRTLRANSLVLPTAVRIGIAAAVGTGVGLAIDAERGAWIGLTAVAVLQASNVHLIAWRTVHRAVGSIVGAGLAAAILVADPRVVVIVLVIAVCQTIAQATITVAYGVAVVFVTPIALLSFDLGQPGTPIGSLLGERVVDTLIGCAIGLAARRLLWPRTAQTRLPMAQGAVIEAARDVLHAALARPLADSSTLLRRSRRRLQTELLNLRAVHGDAVGDLLWSARGGDEGWARTLAAQRVAYAAMAVPADRHGPPPDMALVARLDAALDAMAAIAEGHRAPALIAVPPLDRYPVTHRALIQLRDALRGPSSDLPEAEEQIRGRERAGSRVFRGP